MTDTKVPPAPSGLSKEEEVLAYGAAAVLIAAIGLVIGAILTAA